ncbi:MAG: hypothetical protein ACKOK8_07030, partial [Planctomycetia bacterium]
ALLPARCQAREASAAAAAALSGRRSASARVAIPSAAAAQSAARHDALLQGRSNSRYSAISHRSRFAPIKAPGASRGIDATHDPGDCASGFYGNGRPSHTSPRR